MDAISFGHRRSRKRFNGQILGLIAPPLLTYMLLFYQAQPCQQWPSCPQEERDEKGKTRFIPSRSRMRQTCWPPNDIDWGTYTFVKMLFHVGKEQCYVDIFA